MFANILKVLKGFRIHLMWPFILISILIIQKYPALAADNTGFHKCPQQTQFCPPHWSCCGFGKEYCSSRSGACENVYFHKAGPLESCCDVIEKNSTNQEGLLDACYWLFGSLRLEQECQNLQQPKNDQVNCDNTITWWTHAFGIALSIAIILLIAFVFALVALCKTMKHLQTCKADRSRVVMYMKDDDITNVIERDVAPVKQALITQSNETHATDDGNSESPLEPVEQHERGFQNGLIHRQNSDNGPPPQITMEVGNPRFAPTDELRNIHIDDASAHDWPGSCAPSGKEYKGLNE